MLRAAQRTAGPSCVLLLGKSFASSTKVAEILNDAQFKKALSEPGHLNIVEWTAKWCPPCKMIQPVVDALSVQHWPQARFYKVDVDNDAVVEAVQGAQVTSVPTFQFWRDGRELAAFSGADRGLLQQYVEELSDQAERSKP